MPISPPVQITVPFATSGLKNAIPATTDNITGNAGYDAGFGSINMTPKTAGGIPPFGQDFNGIFFDLTTAIRFLEAGGSFPYSSTFSTAVGGYPIGAIVSRTDNTGLWRNTVANNTTNPETFGAGWQPEDAGITTVAMTNANVTLTALQAARTIITITGTLTANLNLVFPTYSKQWLVVNNGTGAFTVTAKTAAGSGVAIGTGSTQAVYGDGTNIVANSGSSAGLLRNIQTFTASGTYTATTGTTSVVVELVGGGGAGGFAFTTGAGTASCGGGGGAGAYTRTRITSGFNGQTITIGQGGIATTSTAPNGTASSFGALATAAGGSGGASAGPSSQAHSGQGGNGGAQGVTGTIINSSGQPGSAGLFIPSAASSVRTGNGGSGPFGGGGPSGSPGVNATGAGAGGGGSNNSVSTAATAGGNGSNGIVIVYEY